MFPASIRPLNRPAARIAVLPEPLEKTTNGLSARLNLGFNNLIINFNNMNENRSGYLRWHGSAKRECRQHAYHDLLSIKYKLTLKC